MGGRKPLHEIQAATAATEIITNQDRQYRNCSMRHLFVTRNCTLFIDQDTYQDLKSGPLREFHHIDPDCQKDVQEHLTRPSYKNPSRASQKGFPARTSSNTWHLQDLHAKFYIQYFHCDLYKIFS